MVFVVYNYLSQSQFFFVLLKIVSPLNEIYLALHLVMLESISHQLKMVRLPLLDFQFAAEFIVSYQFLHEFERVDVVEVIQPPYFEALFTAKFLES